MFDLDHILGGLVGVTTLVGAFLLQALDAPVVKEITGYLVPFNTAITTLMWWRITQIEKTLGKMEIRMYNQKRQARRYRRGEETAEDIEEDEN